MFYFKQTTMKKIYLLLIVLLLLSCKSKMPTNTKVEEVKNEPILRFTSLNFSKVTTFKINKSYELGRRLMETCNTSRFKNFTTSEATASVIKNATVEKISKTCQKINSRNGKFIDLDLLEIIQDNETGDLIFKYSIKYEKKYYQRELKMVLNNENKISSIATKEIVKKPM